MQPIYKKQHITGLAMLSITAILWGAGFVLNDNLLKSAFADTPNLINTIRFGIATLLLGVVFARKLKFNRDIVLYASLGGLMLFGGFTLQLLGLQRTTPSHNGFFTASYVVFVPFVAWILRKKRPSWVMFLGVSVAIAGLAILNLNTNGVDAPVSETIVGDLLTLACALLFACQIALTDYVYAKDKVDYANMTFWQALVAFVLFALYGAIFESKHYGAIVFDPAYCIWRLAIVSIGGTAFAYFAQGYAQKHLSPTETSVILACESPLGAIISVLAGIEPFVWTTGVGGALVLASVLIMELAPKFIKHSDKKDESPADAETDLRNKE